MHFANALNTVKATTIVGELLEQSIGWAALMLHNAVANHTDKTVRDFVIGWVKSPFVYQFETMFVPNSVMMGSSPRFDMNGNQFGLGKGVTVQSGYAIEFVGKPSLYLRCEGGGSVDLEICLSPDSMRALESYQEFMDEYGWNRLVIFSYPCSLVLVFDAFLFLTYE
ncbi:hypothetical protein Cgig2_023323 [Carnegiea gigantea]|uniref:Uncharacterized protein n=1 Tax=Carnegiea gigantea TaxID=171969 RepID=A0A9Q1K3Z0_9CARY|nr:hypothetical protein Cgig2_023323 [Carnegiea gigantea]